MNTSQEIPVLIDTEILRTKSEEILYGIGLVPNDFFRFRNATIDATGFIDIYTRGGGENNKCWKMDSLDGGVACRDDIHNPNCVVSMHDRILKHPLYANDYDGMDENYRVYIFISPDAKTLGLSKDIIFGEHNWPRLYALLNKQYKYLPKQRTGRKYFT